tara:strand:- start:917 stop:1822 length:906 start_codon:yes stop_codon:yes gene_type:complete
MSKCIVTGGCGFIGSNLVDRLIELGNQVQVIDNLSATCNNKFYKNPSASYSQVNITNHGGVKRIFNKFKPDFVFHLAANSRIQVAMKKPIETCDVNFTGTANLLQLSTEHNVKRFILSSTSSVYGLNSSLPLDENAKVDCLNIYSSTKYGAESLCKMFNNLHGLPTIIFRYFNVYGPREPVKGLYAPVVGLFLKQFHQNKEMTIVGDGLQTRDFTHVHDVVKANVKAASVSDEKCFGEVFNVGSGSNNSVLELAERIGGPFTFLPPREGEAQDTLANIQKIKKYLSWTPSGSILNYIDAHK